MKLTVSVIVDRNYKGGENKYLNSVVTPCCSGFWEPHAVCHDNQIYCLQGIQDEQALGAFLLQFRRVLKFNNTGWKIADLV